MNSMKIYFLKGPLCEANLVSFLFGKIHLDIAPKTVQRRRRSDVIHCQIMRGNVAYFSCSVGIT